MITIISGTAKSFEKQKSIQETKNRFDSVLGVLSVIIMSTGLLLQKEEKRFPSG